LNSKKNEIHEKSQGKGFKGPLRGQKGNHIGVTKHFVVELGTKSNDVGPTANPKQPIPRLSKFVVGKNGENMADERDRK
jgi:hypothetical protein